MSGALLFTGGPVFTADPARPWATAVAVRGGRIVAVGDPAAAAAAAGPDAEVVDLNGRLLVPGFHDAHVHPLAAGLQQLGCDLDGTVDAAGCVAAVAAYARANPEAAWIVGSGWMSGFFPGGTPDRHALDRVVPDRPVLLMNSDQHDAWVNTAALRLAGVDRGTPDPPDGRIAREPDGTPQGTLHEAAARLVARHRPPVTAADLERALRTAQRQLHALGVTAWLDACVGPYLDSPDPYPTYRALDARGLLTARVTGALWWDRDHPDDQAQVAELAARRSAATGGRFAATHVKIMQDGLIENRTAALKHPYLAQPGQDAAGQPPADAPGPRGHSYLDPDRLRQVVAALDAAGFTVHFHAVGDRAAAECLDAVAAAGGSPAGAGSPMPRGRRHTIAHVHVVDPADLPRFAALGVVAAIQPLWAAQVPQMTALIAPALGPARYDRQYPFRGLLRAGVRLAAGSDWPVSDPSPPRGLHTAVTRLPARTSAAWLADLPQPAPLNHAERLTLTDALTAYTAGSAYAAGLDAVSGSITAGKAADLVVLDRDPFAAAATEIEHARADLTFVDGVPVHQHPSQ